MRRISTVPRTGSSRKGPHPVATDRAMWVARRDLGANHQGFPDRPRGRRPPCRSCGGGRTVKGRPRVPGMPAPKINLISIGCGRACPPGPAPCPPAPHPNNGRRPMVVRSIIAICIVTLSERLDRGRLGQRSAQSRQGSCSTPANAVFDFYRSSLAQSSVIHADDRAVI
jgi:hypothetical protein